MADFAAETALAEAANTPSTDHNEAFGQDGDNKFQKAISAWRSMHPQPYMFSHVLMST
jgi:homeobox protein cut-like